MLCLWPVLLSLLSPPGVPAAPQDPERARPVARVGRIDPAAAPRIDGRMTDACWRDAPSIGELTMVEPWLLRVATQRTVVKLLHDQHALYIGLWCYDDDPARIRASQRARDARLDPDDRVEILLDPFENRRIAYFFQLGAGGSIGDILISGNGSRFDKPWDARWQGASRVTDEGWFGEIAIPFRSLPRRDGATSWGFNLRRYVRAADEQYQWARPEAPASFYRASECGTIAGFGAIDDGAGVEVVPYVAIAAQRDRAAGQDAFRFDPDAGGEIYLRLLPSLTLTTTVRTDFAETEDDGRQINLNRFPLFFPEKRDFFLEGLGYFTFGAADAGSTRYLPFFSRRVGLAGDGTPIPLQWGVKLTGEAGPVELGVLDVETGATDRTAGENLAVARVKYAIDEQTTIGLLGTNGDPSSAGDNGLAGVDFYHREPNVLGDLDLTATFDAAVTTGSLGDDDGESLGGQLRANGREWEVAVGSRWVAADFRPALGFVPRRDTWQSSLGAAFRPRTGEGGALRRGLAELSLLRAEDAAGSPQRVLVAIEGVGVELHGGDRVVVFAQREFERIDADFRLFRDSTPVPAGDYWSTRAGVDVRTSEGRDWNGSLRLATGDLFGGRSDQVTASGEWRTSALLHLGGSYDSAIVDLGPGRAFATHIASARVDLFPDNAVSLRNLVQYDNESNLLSWQSRLRCMLDPASDLFVVLGTAWQRDPDGSIAPTEQVLELKLVHSLRF